MRYIWYDGEITVCDRVQAHLMTHSLHYGSAVFEGIRIYNSQPFRLLDHISRLIKSAEIVGYRIPYPIDRLCKSCLQIISAENISDGYLRPIAWKGGDQIEVYAPNNTIHVAIACWEWPNLFSRDTTNAGPVNPGTPTNPAPVTCVVGAIVGRGSGGDALKGAGINILLNQVFRPRGY